MSLIVDVIIPVFRGEGETRACLQSVLGARVETAHEVVVIDDASPEPPLSAFLRSLAAEKRITLIEHRDNRGFVASANEGLALHRDRHVVLLNSDTEVADGWLDRLVRHLEAPNTGTVTPFSNNATILSYPRPHANNPLPKGATTAELDAAFAAANPGRAIEIPTAVGFCMLIARPCLEAVGLFDEARYGAGYGEEVDFCMRATRAGFVNRIAADVFVRHVGEVSFGGSGAARREAAQATIDSLYPEFRPAVADFVARDPLLAPRRAADLERLRRSPRPRLLFTSHNRRGGVQRHLEDLAAALHDDAEVLLLRPWLRSYVSLRWLAPGEAMELWFHARDDWERLVEILRGVGVSRVHFHHVHGLPQAVLSLPGRLGVPWDLTLHDYFPICPQYQLTDATGRYCEEPDAGGCRRCLEGYPVQWPLGIDEWRAAFRPVVEGAARVIAPSRDAADRLARYFPATRPIVRAHFEEQAESVAPFKILVPGGISKSKGFALLEACARDAQARGLPLHFRVLGYIALPLPQWPELPLSVSGEFAEGTLPRLIALERGDAFFFPAQWPETWSYTLSAALETGLPIVATDLGAFPERLADVPRARIVHWKREAAEFNDALLEAAGRAHAAGASLRREVPDIEAYRKWYAAPLSSALTSGTSMPRLDERLLAPPHEEVPQPTLVGLYDDGVVCGSGASRAELRLKAHAGDAALARVADLEARFQDAQRRADEAEERATRSEQEIEQARGALAAARAALGAAEEHHRRIVSSTSWRITGPLRALVHWLRRS